MPQMVFHAPYPVGGPATSASRLRPQRMREAFSRIGYEVIDVSGTVAQRRTRIAEVRRRLGGGWRPEFVYSENSTSPNALAGPVRSGFAPRLDMSLFHAAARAGVPTGVFYRDIYWRFPDMHSPDLVWEAARQVFHRLDLRGYRRNAVHLFLPSDEMAPFVPDLDPARASALPPGCTLRAHEEVGGVHLFYVGPVGPGYAIDQVLAAVAGSPGGTGDTVDTGSPARPDTPADSGPDLVVCTPADTWQSQGPHYAPLLGPRTRVVHASGPDLEPLYRTSTVGVLMVEPSPYRSFAVPYKLFEYLGWGLPVLATENTLAGDLVRDTGAGWALPNDAATIRALLDHLVAHPEEVRARAARAREVGRANTWEVRARSAALTLTEGSH